MKDPKDAAEKLAAQMRDTFRKGAATVPDGAIGRKVFELLKDSDSVTLDDLISALRIDLEANDARPEPGAQMIAGETEAAIIKLQTLRAPRSDA